MLSLTSHLDAHLYILDVYVIFIKTGSHLYRLDTRDKRMCRVITEFSKLCVNPAGMNNFDLTAILSINLKGRDTINEPVSKGSRFI